MWSTFLLISISPDAHRFHDENVRDNKAAEFAPYITIDGTYAPGPGIMLQRHGIEVRTHDVVLRQFRIRIDDQMCEETTPGLFMPRATVNMHFTSPKARITASPIIFP